MTGSVDPLVREAAAVRLLPGLSGAQVYLMTTDGTHWFVRKGASSPAGNDRLRKQADRQKQLVARLAADVIQTPRILAEAERDGRYYFDMELVRGTDAASYLRRASYQEVNRLTGRLCDYLRRAAESPAVRLLEATLADRCLGRIARVQRSTNGLSERVLSCLFLAFEAARPALTRPPTLCHGDFTLENLLVREDGSLCAVDLLDGPIEHYWQDVAKLHQDLSGEWYRRYQPPIAPCVLGYVSQQIRALCASLDPAHRRVHDLLVAFQFVRILPYVRSKDERGFVQGRLEHFAARAVAERSEGE